MESLENLKFIPADDIRISYMGRIGWENKSAPKIVFAGTSITLNFVGTRISAIIFNHRFYNIMELGVIVDGREYKVNFDVNYEKFELTLAEGLEYGRHSVTLFKRQDATHYFDFFGFAVDKNAEILPAVPRPERRIECYGDSVSAGAVCEATEYTAKCDPENNEGQWDNAWHSYSMITARNLGAEINNIAQGGIAIFDGTGYYHAPDHIGMETAYNKVCYFPEAEGGYSDWDFSGYIPHVVIFAVGQNDQHNEHDGDPDISDPLFREKWKGRYKEIIRDLRTKYPDSQFILLLTVLMHDPEWDKAVDEIARELNDEGDAKISHLMFTRSGKATPGHPRLSEQYEMAEELTAYISKMGDSIWK